jgi:hypothetical protein
MVEALKTDLETSFCPFHAEIEQTISIADREDGQSIQKTKKAFEGSLPYCLCPEMPLVKEKFTLASPLNSPAAVETSVAPVTLAHPSMDPEFLKAVDTEFARLSAVSTEDEKIAEPEAEANFLIRVRKVVAEILAQLSKVSEKDRFQMEDMKQKYRNSSQEAADLQRTLGNAGLIVSVIGFGVLLSQFGFKNPADREVMKFLSEQCPSIGGMFTSRYQAHQKEADALSQLMLAEYNAKTSKSQSESSSKQEITNLLDKALESMKRAAASA